MDKVFNKSDLIEELAKKHDVPSHVAKVAVETFFKEIIEGLKKGHQIQIRGFGSFKLKSYSAYKGKDPRTKKTIEVKAKKMPFFKAGSIKDDLN